MADSKFQHHLKPSNRNKKRFQIISLIIVVLLTITACNNTDVKKSSFVTNSSLNKNTLNIWWDKGFNPEEDEALRQLVHNWEKKTGKKINLLFYTTDSLGEKIRRVVKSW